MAIEGNRARLEIGDLSPSRHRRQNDRPNVFCIDVSFEEERMQMDPEADMPLSGGGPTQTKILVAVSPQTDRNRRGADTAAQARELLISLRAYLMASEQESCPPEGAIDRAKRILAPWLARK